MPNYCCVRKCSSNGGFRFPHDPALREQWVSAIKRDNWAPSSHSVVCSQHFKPEEIIIKSESENVGFRRRRKLAPTAVPSIFDLPDGELRENWDPTTMRTICGFRFNKRARLEDDPQWAPYFQRAREEGRPGFTSRPFGLPRKSQAPLPTFQPVTAAASGSATETQCPEEPTGDLIMSVDEIKTEPFEEELESDHPNSSPVEEATLNQGLESQYVRRVKTMSSLQQEMLEQLRSSSQFHTHSADGSDITTHGTQPGSTTQATDFTDCELTRTVKLEIVSEEPDLETNTERLSSLSSQDPSPAKPEQSIRLRGGRIVLLKRRRVNSNLVGKNSTVQPGMATRARRMVLLKRRKVNSNLAGKDSTAPINMEHETEKCRGSSESDQSTYDLNDDHCYCMKTGPSSSEANSGDSPSAIEICKDQSVHQKPEEPRTGPSSETQVPLFLLKVEMVSKSNQAPAMCNNSFRKIMTSVRQVLSSKDSSVDKTVSCNPKARTYSLLGKRPAGPEMSSSVKEQTTANSQQKPIEEVFVCAICHLEFHSRETLAQHACCSKLHTDSFRCTRCAGLFDTRAELVKHVRAEHRPKHMLLYPHKCKMCRTDFETAELLSVHESLDHPWQCETCGLRFHKTCYLILHEKYAHSHTASTPSVLAHICEYCGIGFCHPHQYRLHLRKKHLGQLRDNHRGVNTFFCTVCNRGFLMKYQLTRHMISHREERPHQCEECGKTFKSEDGLQVHQYTHNVEKKFMCELCGMKLSSRTSYKRHKVRRHRDTTKVSK